DLPHAPPCVEGEHDHDAEDHEEVDVVEEALSTRELLFRDRIVWSLTVGFGHVLTLWMRGSWNGHAQPYGGNAILDVGYFPYLCGKYPDGSFSASPYVRSIPTSALPQLPDVTCRRYLMAAPPNALERPALRLLSAADALGNRLYGSRFNPLYQSGTIVIALLLVMIVSGLWLILLDRKST